MESATNLILTFIFDINARYSAQTITNSSKKYHFVSNTWASSRWERQFYWCRFDVNWTNTLYLSTINLTNRKHFLSLSHTHTHIHWITFHALFSHLIFNIIQKEILHKFIENRFCYTWKMTSNIVNVFFFCRGFIWSSWKKIVHCI